MFSMNFDF